MGGSIQVEDLPDDVKDVFGDLVTKNTTNESNLAGHYPYSPQGGGSSTSVSEASGLGNRELYPGDIAIIWVDSNTEGVHEIDVLTEQNS